VLSVAGGLGHSGAEAEMTTESRETKYRQAVVVVHGMGDRKPAETLRRAIAAILPQRTESGPDNYPKACL